MSSRAPSIHSDLTKHGSRSREGPQRYGRGHGVHRGYRARSFRNGAKRLPSRKSLEPASDFLHSPSPQSTRRRTQNGSLYPLGIQELSPDGDSSASARVRDESYYLGTSAVSGDVSGPSTPQTQIKQVHTPQTVTSSLFRGSAKAFVRTDDSGRLTLVPVADQGSATGADAKNDSSVISWAATDRMQPPDLCGPPKDTAASESDATAIVNHAKKLMAISSDQHSVGCAVWDPASSILWVMDDMTVPNHAAKRDLVEQVCTYAEADVILASTTEEDEFIQQLRKPTIASAAESTYVEIRPRAEWTGGIAKSRLLMAHVHNSRYNPCVVEPASGLQNDMDAEIARKEQRCFEINVWIEPSSVQALGCLGAILQYMSTSNFPELQIYAIQKMILSKIMHLSPDALKSLSIFSTENHPNVHLASSGKNRSKEGLSLFGILDTCHTQEGHQMLKRWLLRPSQEHSIISHRLFAVRNFLASENHAAVEALHAALKGIKNVHHILQKMRRGNPDSGTWLSCLQTVFSIVKMSTYSRQITKVSEIDVLQKMLAVDTKTLNTLGQMINGIVDFDQSTVSGRVIVKSQVDDTLDALRHDFAGLDSFLSLVAEKITEEHAQSFTVPLAVVYFPQIGYLVALPLPPSRDENDYHNLPAWTFLFKSEDQAYFRTSETRELDETIGDIHGMITDLEIEILHRLNLEVLKFERVLLQCTEICAEVDVLLAFAEASRKHHYTEPTITEENIIDVEEGWDPLQELCVEAFVSNNIHLAGGKGLDVNQNEQEAMLAQDRSVLIMTGANASGKSIYLRQVALIVYMAHLGCFVPAAKARMGLHDQIVTRIATRESSSRHASAFMIDTEQMSYALRNATARSLVVIDEYGKGTDNEIGAALFAAVIVHFLKKGLQCPKVIAATHFHELFERECLPENLPIALAHMQILLYEVEGEELVRIDDSEQRAICNKKITYLFRLQQGRAPSSHAMNVALLHGIPQPVIDRALRVAKHLIKGEPIPPEDSPRDLKKWAILEEMARQFVEWDLEERPGVIKSSENGENEDITLDDVKNLLDWLEAEMSTRLPRETPEASTIATNSNIPTKDVRYAITAGPLSPHDTSMPAMSELESITNKERASPSQKSSDAFSEFDIGHLDFDAVGKVFEQVDGLMGSDLGKDRHDLVDDTHSERGQQENGKQRHENWQEL